MSAREFDTFDTAIGACGIAWSADGVTDVQLPMADDAALLARMQATGAARAERRPRKVGQAVTRIQRHLDGRPADMVNLALDLSGLTPFRRQVSEALRQVGPGQVTTYGELSRRCGRGAGGSRAVGAAMANNPAPLIVPCHRVLAAGGALGGFSSHGGVSTKLRLLSMEGADLEPVAQAGVARLRRQDPRLAAVIRGATPYRLSTMQGQDMFTLLCRSIVHQQVSMKAGATIYGRLLKVGGRGSKMSIKRTLAASHEALRGAGLSGQKVSYVQDLALKLKSGALPPARRLSHMDDAAVIDALVQVRGIGVWSAQMFLMFHLGRLDVLPVDDLGLQNGAQRVFGLDQRPGKAALRELAEPWRPFRSIATWYLWRATEAGGV